MIINRLFGSSLLTEFGSAASEKVKFGLSPALTSNVSSRTYFCLHSVQQAGQRNNKQEENVKRVSPPFYEDEYLQFGVLIVFLAAVETTIDLKLSAYESL